MVNLIKYALERTPENKTVYDQMLKEVVFPELEEVTGGTTGEDAGTGDQGSDPAVTE